MVSVLFEVNIRPSENDHSSQLLSGLARKKKAHQTRLSGNLIRRKNLDVTLKTNRVTITLLPTNKYTVNKQLR